MIFLLLPYGRILIQQSQVVIMSFQIQIRNPCGETRSVQYIAVVHGRDIPSDGDGMLSIVNNANGSSIIQVCEGAQSIVTLRDNSTWNCQNPVLPGGLTPVPNIDPRNIEWLYGRDPGGVVYNSITGTVNVATLGSAPQTSGRIISYSLWTHLPSARQSQSLQQPGLANISGSTLKTGTNATGADPGICFNLRGH